MGDTAAGSDLQWMVNEFGFGGTESRSGVEAEAASASASAAATATATATESDSPKSTTTTTSSKNDSLSRTLEEEELLALASSNLHTQFSQTATRRNCNNKNIAPHISGPGPGPNEQVYVQNYQRGVQNRIQEHRRRHPNDLPIYGQLSDTEKLEEQQRVLRLLQRLKIATVEDNPTVNATSDCSQPETASASAAERNLLPNRQCHSNSNENYNYSLDADDTDTNASELLLSPPPPTTSSLVLEKQDDNSHRSSDNSFDSTQSVEQTRSAAPFFDSPASCSSNAKKRLATTSGKRGADAARLRIFHGSDNIDNDDEPSLLHSIRRLSLHDDGNVFTASQSPISQHLTHSPLRHQPMDEDSSSSSAFSNTSNRNHGPDISFGRDDSSMDDSTTMNNDCHAFQQKQATTTTTDDTLVETSMLPGKMVRWDFDGTLVKNAPTDVRLATGKVFTYTKLPVQSCDPRHNSSSNNNPSNKYSSNAPSFPDPFAFYDDNAKLQRRLYRLYEWVVRRDQAAQTKEKKQQQQHQRSACAVLSIELEQIVDLVLKLALEYPVDDDVGDDDAIRSDSSTDALLGQTLIVARTKEELEIFGQAFLERSSFSVLDHSILPLKDRKSLSTARRAAQFDVVLTTYDAFKALDSTITVDERGHALHRKDTTNDGWYTSKNICGGGTAHQSPDLSFDPETNSSETVVSVTSANKQLSVLHQMIWRRVVFVDELGRKCFVAKAGTARVAAATALSARSR